MKITFSVIIPLYNMAQYIERALLSILHQTYQNFEIIVVDDGSNDEGEKIVDFITQKDSRIKLFKLNHNQGVSAARNIGISQARGEVIAFLDADDEWEPQYLDMILLLRKDFPNCEGFASSYRFIESNGKVSNPKIYELDDQSFRGILRNYFLYSFQDAPIYTSSMTITKEALHKLGGFPNGIKCGEDLDLFFRLYLDFQIAFINEKLVTIHKDAQNRSANRDIRSDFLFTLNNLNKRINNSKLSINEKGNAIEYICAKKIMISRDILIRNRNIEARELLKECKKTSIFKWKWIITFISTYIPQKLFFNLFRIRNNFRSRWKKNLNEIEGMK
ncbi:MAG: glycosyltransferase [Anaerolineaceae bacterium]|nr:glycosyltransferase [Anaerolineaceae bacterium]